LDFALGLGNSDSHLADSVPPARERLRRSKVISEAGRLMYLLANTSSRRSVRIGSACSVPDTLSVRSLWMRVSVV
jgi:hypothetical protein